MEGFHLQIPANKDVAAMHSVAQHTCSFAGHRKAMRSTSVSSQHTAGLIDTPEVQRVDDCLRQGAIAALMQPARLC
jgi:hypothetical protein